MPIYCVLQETSAQRKKRGFPFAYKSKIHNFDLAAHPWAARNRWINQRFLSRMLKKSIHSLFNNGGAKAWFSSASLNQILSEPSLILDAHPLALQVKTSCS
ncbi:MAG: hypothetical protein R8K46_09430 [Mariprofundaceae bacterium]